MPLLATTATTDGPNSVPYAVWNDLAPAADTTTRGHTVTLVCDAENEELFLWDMLGYSQLDGATLHRELPQRSEYTSGPDKMYAVSYQHAFRTPKNPAEVGASGWPVWDIAGFNFSFAVPLYKVLSDDEITYEFERYCIWRKKVTAQNEKIPGSTFKFVDDGLSANSGQLPLNEVGVRTGRILELTCQWIDVPVFDYAVISARANTVNNTTVIWDGSSYPEETVLFVGADEVPRVNALGIATRDINFNFLIRLDGRTWNKFWNKAATGADKYTLVTDNGISAGNKPFTSSSLNNLWTFTAP